MRPKYGGNGQGPLETLEEPLCVSSPLGIRARIRMICRGCELEISGTLLTVDLRIMDMSEFDVILGMDYHAPIPGPTRLADPNRFPSCETQDRDS